MATDPTNLVEGGDTSVEDTAALDTGVDTDGEVSTDEQQFDDDGNPIPEPDEDEEVELDEDLKLKVPKSKAQRVREAMLRQADYTRKTQEVAEQRKAVEAERNQFHEASQQELGAYARAVNLEQQIKQFQNVDWNAWHEQDPFAAARATSEYTMAKDAYNQALGQISQFRQQRLSTAQQEAARRLEQGRATLAKEIPGWNDELKAKLIGFAAEYGFSREELDDLEADPRVAKVLQAAYAGTEASRKARKAQNHATAQQVQPAAKVGARSAPPQGLDDRLSAEEWVRRREKQVRERA